MHRALPWTSSLLTTAMLLAGCPGDDGSADGTGSSSGTAGPATSTGETGPSDSTGPASTTNDGTSSSTGPDPDSSTGPGDTDTDTGGIDCTAIPPGPLAAEEVFAPGAVFDGSEDVAFDGMGNLAGKNGGEVVLVDAAGATVATYPDPGSAYGLRYRANGDLLAAHYMAGQIINVIDGSTFAMGVGGVNGLYPDFDDNVWFTNFSEVVRINPDGSQDTIVTGGDASSANGVILDPDRSLVYFTNYGAGNIRAVEIMGDGSPGAVGLVATIPGAAPDGLNLDACGNLYVVDQGNSRLYRVFLDAAGGPVGDPELLISGFPSNVANAVWGSGDGWDPMSLYAAGVPGGVYRVEVGVPGAPYPTP